MPSDARHRPGAGRAAALAAVALWLLAGCGEDTGDEDRTPPPAPAMRAKACDSGLEFPEEGIDAEAGGQGIRLEWTLAERPADLAGFEIWRGEHPDSVFALLDVDPERFLEGDPEWYGWVDTDPALRPEFWWGPRAWYAVTALDGSGNRSQPSDTTTYRLWAAPRLVPDWVDVAGDTLTVQWQFQYADLFVYGFRGFRLTVSPLDASLAAWSREILLGLESTMVEMVDLATTGLARGDWRLRVDTVVAPNDDLDPWGLDPRSNPDGCALSGSESNWISFTY